MRRPRGAFTLVELLVVIAIIGILVALLLPAVQAAREAARRISCNNNMKQVGVALHNYHDTFRALPMGWLGLDPTGKPLSEGEPGWGWAARILPFIEQSAVSLSFQASQPITAPANQQARQTFLPVYRCPSDVGGDRQFDLRDENGNVLVRIAVANYVGMFGTTELEDCEGLPVGITCRGNGSFFHNSATRFSEFIDGLSGTLLVAERASRPEHSTWVGAVPQAQESFARILAIADHAPNAPGGHLDDAGSFHPAGTNFVFGDGSVSLIVETIDLNVYQALATVKGQEAVSFP